MLHPSEQAVDYIWERLVETYFSKEAREMLNEWRPLKLALSHRPFNADSEEYHAFMDGTVSYSNNGPYEDSTSSRMWAESLEWTDQPIIDKRLL
jgi:hypothetical protein